jgi:hypothetical protein
MRKVIFSLAFMLIGSFAFANTNAVVTPKTETIEVVSEKLVTYEIDNPIMGKLSISVPENALNNDAVCGFDVFWNTNRGSGSFWFDCSGGATMGDILDVLLALFF